jgi:dehydratase
MFLLARKTGALCLAAGISLAATVAVAAPASAATVPVTFDCQARPPVGAPQQVPLPTAVDGTAPASIRAGGTFEVVLTPAPLDVPTTIGGYTLNNLHDARTRVAVTNATIQSVRLSGGSNLGSGTPTVSVAGNVVTTSIPGPLAAGRTSQLPTLHLTLTATGAPGSAVVTQLAGSSHDSPPLSFVANVAVLFGVDVPTSCLPAPAPGPTLTSTAIQG